MALKHKVSSLEEVAEKYRVLYTQTDDGYVLDDGVKEDTSALKSAKDYEKAERQKAEARATEAEAKLKDKTDAEQKVIDDKARADKDVDAIEAQWQTRLDTEVGELNDKLTAKDAAINKLVVTSTANRLANEIAVDAGAAKLLAPHIEARLAIGDDNGNPIALVKDDMGVASRAITIDSLKQSFVNNSDFSSVIAGSQGNGGGADETKGGGASKKLNEMNSKERVDFMRANPTEFDNAIQHDNF